MKKYYKENIPLGKIEKSSVDFKTETNFSETSGVYCLTGVEIAYSKKRDVAYIYPKTTKGTHKFRWLAVEKNDIPELVKALKELI